MQIDNVYAEALQRFEEVFQRAAHTGMREPAAVTLATADAEGRPSARVVLLRGFDERGFVFYTNARSAKGRDLEANPRGALCFYWDELREQIRIAGDVVAASDEESDAYWAARPRESKIGAWASDQSDTLQDRAELEERVRQFEEQFAGQDVPRPPHWRGFRVVPRRIEFWVSRPARLHDRTVYEAGPDGWTRRLLYP